MFKKVLSIILAMVIIIGIFAGCTPKDREEYNNESKEPTITDLEYYLPDITDNHVNFGFDIPEAYKKLNSGNFDSDGTYYIYDAGTKVVYCMSKYFVNEVNDYDMLRCNLNDIKSANDIFDKLNYKITFLYQNVLSRKAFFSNSLTLHDNTNIKYTVNHSDTDNIANLDASIFDGTMSFETKSGVKNYCVYGYSIWLNTNPIIFYVVDLNENNNVMSEDYKNNIKNMAYSLIVNPFEYAQKQVDKALAESVPSTTTNILENPSENLTEK